MKNNSVHRSISQPSGTRTTIGTFVLQSTKSSRKSASVLLNSGKTAEVLRDHAYLVRLLLTGNPSDSCITCKAEPPADKDTHIQCGWTIAILLSHSVVAVEPLPKLNCERPQLIEGVSKIDAGRWRLRRRLLADVAVTKQQVRVNVDR